MKKNIAIALVALLLGVLLFTLIDCSTGGAPGSVPTVDETKKIIEGATVGYAPLGTDAYGAFSLYILPIDFFIGLAKIFLDTTLYNWQGSDGTYTVSYSEGNNNYTLTLTIVWDNSREMWHYTLTISGEYDTGEGIATYDNVVVFEMYAEHDGSSGEITLYNPDNPVESFTVTWSKGETYITFSLLAQYVSKSFTMTLKETYPVYDPAQGQWVSESGVIRIEQNEEIIDEVSWGPTPPSL